ncbi:hypothetical protein MKI84_19415 [Ancylobacter sp. A5.8]|uniref:hypothetical protein n=1 Tax=Ancylobacter gelatini TaxID=2919920 RepID=UPI001F4D6D13|nr:hypothetical protein [Ancylobacter gelatini]MCJ8145097.1 hypothetical protein [Ancylobacter gelatini]
MAVSLADQLVRRAIVSVLKEHEARIRTAEVSRKRGVVRLPERRGPPGEKRIPRAALLAMLKRVADDHG